MSQANLMWARIGAALFWGMVSARWSTMPLEYFIVGSLFAAAMIFPAIFNAARSTPWQAWAPEVSAIFCLLGCIIWIEQRPGSTGIIGWVFIFAFSILIIALTIKAVRAMRIDGVEGGRSALDLQRFERTLEIRSSALRAAPENGCNQLTQFHGDGSSDTSLSFPPGHDSSAFTIVSLPKLQSYGFTRFRVRWSTASFGDSDKDKNVVFTLHGPGSVSSKTLEPQRIVAKNVPPGFMKITDWSQPTRSRQVDTYQYDQNHVRITRNGSDPEDTVGDSVRIKAIEIEIM